MLDVAAGSRPAPQRERYAGGKHDQEHYRTNYAQVLGVARIGRDQLEDYAKRRGIPLELAEKYLRPNIGY